MKHQFSKDRHLTVSPIQLDDLPGDHLVGSIKEMEHISWSYQGTLSGGKRWLLADIVLGGSKIRHWVLRSERHFLPKCLRAWFRWAVKI
jgi:hypothetical protein